MPRYYFNIDQGKWVKQCSHCKIVTVGTENESESLLIFQSMFAESGPSSGAADEMQSRCWMCNNHKRRELGATREIVEQLFQRQEGKCEICCKQLSISRNALPSDKAHVDHDASSGVIRALLCGNCNRGIGLFFHRPELLKAAAAYCEHYNNVIPLMVPKCSQS